MAKTLTISLTIWVVTSLLVNVLQAKHYAERYAAAIKSSQHDYERFHRFLLVSSKAVASEEDGFVILGETTGPPPKQLEVVSNLLVKFPNGIYSTEGGRAKRLTGGILWFLPNAISLAALPFIVMVVWFFRNRSTEHVRHIQQRINVSERLQTKAELLGTMVYQCEVCEEMFSGREESLAHVQAKHGMSEREARSHIKRAAPIRAKAELLGTPVYQCNLCEETFSESEESLLLHVQAKHGMREREARSHIKRAAPIGGGS